MRDFVVIAAFTTALLTACDPAGLRRVRLQVPQAPNDGSTIVVTQQDLREALQLLERIVVPLGFKSTSVQSNDTLIAVYMLSCPPVTVEGLSSSRDVPIRVSRTSTGIEVSFGQFGFLAGTPEPVVRAFKDTRTAFVKKYGGKRVKTKTFGSANNRAALDAGRTVCYLSGVVDTARVSAER